MAIAYQSDTKQRTAFQEKLEELGRLNTNTFSVDQGIVHHEEPKNKISLPVGMDSAKGSKILAEDAAAQAQMEVFNKTFRFRPEDGAIALQKVLSKFFGTTGRGKAIQTMFGSIPPQQIEVEVGPNQTVTVAWGHIDFSHLDGTLYLGGTMDAEYGALFHLQLECPKRHAAKVQGLWMLIEEELRTNSIYRGKSLYRVKDRDNGVGDSLKFIDLNENPTIVYTKEVTNALQNTVWGVIEHATLFAQDGRRVNKRVLMHGPYGTGKSEAGVKTAGIANRNGWAFFSFNSGKETLDDLETLLKTARLYQPAVVFIEDVDVYASNEKAEYQTRLSNLFDGVGSKGDKVMLVMTSNRAASFSKAMLRAGRVDRMIEVGPLDREATEEMIRKVVGVDRIEETTDFNAVHEALEGFEPAFVRQTFDQAAEAAIIRTGKLEYKLGTEDFVGAANLLRPQHDLHSNKNDERKITTFDSAFRKVLRDELQDMQGFMEISGDVDASGVLTYSEKRAN